jgi:hypothetical protein
MSNIIDLEYFKLKKDISRDRSPIDEAIVKKIYSIKIRLKRIEDTLKQLKGETV